MVYIIKQTLDGRGYQLHATDSLEAKTSNLVGGIFAPTFVTVKACVQYCLNRYGEEPVERKLAAKYGWR